jgi:predicted acyl esterase
MRATLLAAVLALPLLAGCLGGTSPVETASLPRLDLRGFEVPSGAVLEPVANGVALRFADVSLPFGQNVTVPRGATMVRLTAVLGSEEPLGVGMANAETGRRRCNGPVVETAWNLPVVGQASCAGLTAVDPLPAAWTVRAASSAAARAKLVTVEFLAVPLDGLAARLDLSQLSMPTSELLPTEVLDVPSFDGEPLHLEVTRPDTQDKVPVILASSPYNHADRAAGRLAQWAYFVHDWAKRGYAVVMADVRGFGESGGCVEVWGPGEQRDQAFLVDWAARQPWSDGRVGFYGQSYVGTTPVEAAVQAPRALKAIVAVAPVVNAYQDWHFGGVPNGEDVFSPESYQMLGMDAMMRPDDPAGTAMRTGNGLCDPTLTARANDPRALYDGFYVERNFSARAGDVEAAVLYSQGFEDSNVKAALIPDWFSALPGPKLGLFGHWVHQHSVRADQEVLYLGWMDQWVKGKPLGFERLPAADVLTNVGTHREASAWPPIDPDSKALYARFAEGGLGDAPGDGAAQLLMTPESLAALPVPLPEPPAPQPALLVLERALDRPLHLAGSAMLHLRGTLQGGDNAYVAAFLLDVGGDRPALASWGMVNLAHRHGHDRYDPVMPGETFDADLPFLPTEYVLQAGHTLRLEVRAAHVSDWALVKPGEPGVMTLEGGAAGTQLLLPLAPDEGAAGPLSASR